MPEVFIGIGSNTDPVRGLRHASVELGRRFGSARCSNVYRSPAHGTPAAAYLNMVAALYSDLPVDALKSELRAIEEAGGRSRANAAVCELDLDLLLYGARVDAAQRLPRPGLYLLPFVLGPLAQLAPELVHPVTGERCAAVGRAAGANVALEDLGALRALG